MKRWFEVNEIDPPTLSDDLGDVGDFEEPPNTMFVRITKSSSENSWYDLGDFEEPPLRIEQIINLWKRYYIKTSPQDAARIVSKELGCSIEDICEALRRSGDASISHFAPVILAQVKKGYFYYPEKEMTMEKRKRWYEANEVDPESGYIREVPDAPSDQSEGIEHAFDPYNTTKYIIPYSTTKYNPWTPASAPQAKRQSLRN